MLTYTHKEAHTYPHTQTSRITVQQIIFKYILSHNFVLIKICICMEIQNYNTLRERMTADFYRKNLRSNKIVSLQLEKLS